ncbi:MAG: hypothetical protein AAFV43_06030 [Planctomycetota bacterium]
MIKTLGILALGLALTLSVGAVANSYRAMDSTVGCDSCGCDAKAECDSDSCCSTKGSCGCDSCECGVEPADDCTCADCCCGGCDVNETPEEDESEE